MSTSIWFGKLVRLKVPEPEQEMNVSRHWNENSEYCRLADSFPPRPIHQTQQIARLVNDLSEDYIFSIHTIVENRLIGRAELDGIDWTSGNAWVGIGIGESDHWGQGYGTEALQLLSDLHLCNLIFGEFH